MQKKGKILLGLGAGAGLIAVLFSGGRKRIPRADIEALLIAEADRQGVPRNWVLAWVDRETGGRFDPNAIGDVGWAFRDGGALYREYVLGQRIYDGNPARNDPSRWVSYGLFQLLAPHQLRRAYEMGLLPVNAPPEALLDVRVNIPIGVHLIGKAIERTGSDFVQARFDAAGCSGRDCRDADGIEARSRQAMLDWGIA